MELHRVMKLFLIVQFPRVLLSVSHELLSLIHKFYNEFFASTRIKEGVAKG